MGERADLCQPLDPVDGAVLGRLRDADQARTSASVCFSASRSSRPCGAGISVSRAPDRYAGPLSSSTAMWDCSAAMSRGCAASPAASMLAPVPVEHSRTAAVLVADLGLETLHDFTRQVIGPVGVGMPGVRGKQGLEYLGLSRRGRIRGE